MAGLLPKGKPKPAPVESAFLHPRCPVCSNRMEPCLAELGCSFWLCLDCPLGWDQTQSVAHSKHRH